MNFARMTIIATTNAGAASKRPVGFGVESGSASRHGPAAAPLAALRETFPVELLNRFDEIIPFRPLDREDCARIVRELLIPEALRRAGLTGAELTVTPACVDAIVDAGYRPEFAARGLNRAFQDLLLQPLSESKDRIGGTIIADVVEGRIRILPSERY